MPEQLDTSETLEQLHSSETPETFFSAEMSEKFFSAKMKILIQPDTAEKYLKLVQEIIHQAQRTTSESCSMPPKFNLGQCKYLADKLEVAVENAQMFLERLSIESFKLLYALAKQVESFILECCKDAWIQAALTLTHTSEHISSIGFNLEFYRIVFSDSRKWGASESSSSLTELIDKMSKGEVETVRGKALDDKNQLLEKVKALRQSGELRVEDRELARRLLQRLLRARDLTRLSPKEFYERDISSVTQTKSLGEGNFGTVRKGQWLGVDVAMKVTKDPTAFPSFQKEVTTQARLSHSNITSLFCYAEDELRKNLIMDLMDIDLYALIRKRLKRGRGFPFSILVAVDIMLQVGGGMHYMHGMQTLHRDLKPRNILLRRVKKTEYVLAKIADFGESKMMDKNTMDMTANKGSLRYKAPEMIISRNPKSEAEKAYHGVMLKHPYKCDVHSFAMVCSEILTGNQPFSDIESFSEFKEKIWSGERPKLPDWCPKELKNLIERCWSPDASKRPCFGDICKELRILKCVLLMTDEVSSNVYSSPYIQSVTEYSSELDPFSITEDFELVSNRGYFQYLKRRQDERKAEMIRLGLGRDVPGFLIDMDDLVVHEKITVGGQAKIFRGEAGERTYVLKVFENSLRNLEKWWPPGMLNAFDRYIRQGSPLSLIHGATLLRDDRFAVVMHKQWGDLRKLIDLRMLKSNSQGPPFTENQVFTMMAKIARDMLSLHSESPPIVHRDLKAANVLVQGFHLPSLAGGFEVTVSDFDCNIGVCGTGFWRAPEVLQKLKDRSEGSTLTFSFTEKSDVYSYGMVCYELVTGLIPFKHHKRGQFSTRFDFVLSGDRPKLPPDLDPLIQGVIHACWHTDPSQRPSFHDIVDTLSRSVPYV